MGRNAPEQEYEIIFCKNQSENQARSNWSRPLGKDINGNDRTVSLVFPGTFASPNAVFTTGGRFPVVPNTPVYVNDDLSSLTSFFPVSLSFNGTTRDNVDPFYSFNTSGKIQNDGGSTYYVVLPTLTGLTRTGIPGNIHFPKGKYLQTDNSGGLMLTQGITGNSSSSGLSGYRVGLQRITFADTGVIVGSSYYIPDTITNLTTAGTGNSSKYTLADFEVDVSYTGDTKRVLIGYMGITGATSGNLCARLAEINGEVITYGDPVVIRSVIPSGALRQSISITYHSSGLDTNCFVVATTVDPGNLAVRHSTSGEIVACNPISGLDLSGYFGTPVTTFNSNTTGVTGQISRVQCAALECTDASLNESGVGYLVGVHGISGASGTPTGTISIQQYTISGNTLVTGQVRTTGVFATNIPNVSTHHEFSGSLASFYPTRSNLFSFKTTVSGSGLLVYTNHAGTGISGYDMDSSNYSSQAGSGLFSLVRVTKTFTTGANVPVRIYQNTTRRVNLGGYGNVNPFYIIPENPYSGAFGSAFSFEPRQKTTNTYLSNPLVISVYKINASGLESDAFDATDVCLLNTGVSFTGNYGVLDCTGNSVSNGIASGGFPNIIHVSGSFPNYQKVYAFTHDFEDKYIATYNFGQSGEIWNTANHSCSFIASGLGDNYFYKMPLGIVIGSSGNPNNTGIVVSGDTAYINFTDINEISGDNSTFAPSSGIIVKIATTDSQRRKLANQTPIPSSIVIIRNKSIIDI